MNKLKDIHFQIRCNLWELKGKFNREDLSKEEFDNYIKFLLSEYPRMDYTEEKKIIYRDHNTFEEVMDTFI